MTWRNPIAVTIMGIALIAVAIPVSAQSSAILSSPIGAPDQVVTPAPGIVTIHVVQRGEDLFQIAQKYGTTVDNIAQANGIDNPALIMVGQRLVIPNAVNHPGVPITYMVGPSDSLPVLAWRYGTSITQIATQNNILNPALLYIGLPLSLISAATSTPISNGRVVTVQAHDTWFSLAMQYGQSPDVIAAANGLTVTAVLYTGQLLAIPGNKSNKNSTALINAPVGVTQFSIKPAVLEQGRSAALEITTAVQMQLHGTFLNRPVIDRSDDGGLTHTVFIGANAFTTPGIYPLQLTGADSTGQVVDLSRLIAISDGNYGSEQIILPSNLKDLTDPKITQPELDKLAAITSKVTPKRYFNGAFGLPAPATIVSQFGTRRSYDGAPYNQFHSGTDFAGAPGSPIYAPMAGVVVFTGLMQIRGNITIIDHGWGIYTAYCHQSQILVNVGQTVQPGQVIGKIGATGRVTGPHLHWELYVEGVQVDPMQWARTSFP